MRIVGGDIRALALAPRASSRIAGRKPKRFFARCFHQTGRALILGVTGAPGAGKSTLCDGLIEVLRGEGQDGRSSGNRVRPVRIPAELSWATEFGCSGITRTRECSSAPWPPVDGWAAWLPPRRK